MVPNGTWSSKQKEFHPKPLTEPYPGKSGQAVTVSRHTVLLMKQDLETHPLSGWKLI